MWVLQHHGARGEADVAGLLDFHAGLLGLLAGLPGLLDFPAGLLGLLAGLLAPCTLTRIWRAEERRPRLMFAMLCLSRGGSSTAHQAVVQVDR